jgi:hypothetical protein
MPVTEAEWLAATDPGPMLEYLRGKASDRKGRLFACACARSVHNPDDDSHPAEVDENRRFRQSEDYADGRAEPPKLVPDWRPDVPWLRGLAYWAIAGQPAEAANAAAHCAYLQNQDLRDPYDWSLVISPDKLERTEMIARSAQEAERKRQSEFLRDLFGNPFRRVPLVDPAWLAWKDDSVRRLAGVAYEERQLPKGTLDPERLSLLADALEDAGCTHAELLGHLRSPGPHVRGCWAVDLVLGKS